MYTNLNYHMHIGDYAIYLHRRKKDFKLADKYYQITLETYPYQSSIHLKYAGFLRYIKKDLSKAETHYILAIQHNRNSETIGKHTL